MFQIKLALTPNPKLFKLIFNIRIRESECKPTFAAIQKNYMVNDF